MLASNAKLRQRDGALSAAIEAAGFDLATAFVLEWIPEQAEDLFVVLAGPDGVVRVELVRDSGTVVAFQVVSVGDYKPPTRPLRVRLSVALELVRSAAP